MKTHVLLSMLMALTTVCLAAESGPDESRLRQELLEDYDKTTRPGGYSEDGGTTKVMVNLQLLFVQACERKMKAVVSGWMMLNWKDPRLMWDPKYFNNLNKIRIHADRLWTPDLLPYNAYPTIRTDWLSSTLTVVNNDGSVTYVPPFSVTIPCQQNSTSSQDDDLICALKLGSWTYDMQLVDLSVPETGEVNMDEYRPTGRWKVHNSSAARVQKKYPCCEVDYVSDEITLKLNRRNKVVVTRYEEA